MKNFLLKVRNETRKMVQENPEGRAAFEKWYFEKYGKQYEWEKTNDKTV